jgi:hypothetical protein
MRLATIRVPGGTRAVRLDGGQAVETGHNDAGELLPTRTGAPGRRPPTAHGIRRPRSISPR